MSIGGTGQGPRASMVLGVLLIAMGLFALVARMAGLDLFAVGWPAFVIIPGLLLFAGALVVGGRPGIALAVPAGVVTMTGLVLAFQNTTGDWQTWAYAWALVAPGGIGIGLFAYGVFSNQRDVASSGLPVMAVGLGLFLAFGFFFEGILNLSGGRFGGFDALFAGGLIVLGLVVLVSGLVGRRPARD